MSAMADCLRMDLPARPLSRPSLLSARALALVLKQRSDRVPPPRPNPCLVVPGLPLRLPARPAPRREEGQGQGQGSTRETTSSTVIHHPSTLLLFPSHSAQYLRRRRDHRRRQLGPCSATKLGCSRFTSPTRTTPRTPSRGRTSTARSRLTPQLATVASASRPSSRPFHQLTSPSRGLSWRAREVAVSVSPPALAPPAPSAVISGSPRSAVEVLRSHLRRGR